MRAGYDLAVEREQRPGRQRLQEYSIEADLSQPDAPDRIVAFALERFGQLDSLINNAGVNRRMPIFDVDPGTLDMIWSLNFQQP